MRLEAGEKAEKARAECCSGSFTAPSHGSLGLSLPICEVGRRTSAVRGTQSTGAPQTTGGKRSRKPGRFGRAGADRHQLSSASSSQTPTWICVHVAAQSSLGAECGERGVTGYTTTQWRPRKPESITVPDPTPLGSPSNPE